MNWEPTWQQALSYQPFLDAHAEQRHKDRWQKVYDDLKLDDAHSALLATFKRKMHMLCVAGAWCGDCVLQGPILQKIAEVNPAVELRFVDRDKHSDAQEEVQINLGRRVPVVVFLAEDFHEVGRSASARCRRTGRWRPNVLAPRARPASCHPETNTSAR